MCLKVGKCKKRSWVPLVWPRFRGSESPLGALAFDRRARGFGEGEKPWGRGHKSKFKVGFKNNLLLIIKTMQTDKKAITLGWKSQPKVGREQVWKMSRLVGRYSQWIVLNKQTVKAMTDWKLFYMVITKVWKPMSDNSIFHVQIGGQKFSVDKKCIVTFKTT